MTEAAMQGANCSSGAILGSSILLRDTCDIQLVKPWIQTSDMNSEVSVHFKVLNTQLSLVIE